MSVTTFAPGLGAKSAMDLAVTAMIPDGIPPTLAPLLKVVYGFLLKKGRIDITAFISKTVIVAGAVYSLKIIWDFVQPLVLSTLTTSITLPVEHQTAKDIQAWLGSRGSSRASQHIKYTATGMTFDKATQRYRLEGEKQTNINRGWFFFANQPLYFIYNRIEAKDRTPVYVESNDHGSKQLSGDEITVYAVGFSRVLEDLVKEVSVAQVAVKGTTIVFNVTDPSAEDAYRTGYFAEWMPRSRPSRPMSTIDLSADIKKSVLDDITQFLEPSREKFYSDRGIKYSRGILLFGPPGTGKSSFALALAGMVRGALYQANVGEIKDEAHMRRLFMCPEKGDVLILEDIDCANIKREKMKGEEKKKKTKKGRRRRNSDNIPAQNTTSISLSGLLNAIDAIPDGVILLMTSNSPESLDKALVRPGRIDKQVLFGYITKAVAEAIFLRMYQDPDSKFTSPDVRALAILFAKKIPELKLTPAEVQGFLIPRQDPRVAVAEADKWIADVLEAREKGLNIVGAKGDDEALGLKKKKKKTKGKKRSKDTKDGKGKEDKAEENKDEEGEKVDNEESFFDACERIEDEKKVEIMKHRKVVRRKRSHSLSSGSLVDDSLSDTAIDSSSSSESNSDSESSNDGSDSDDSSNDSASEDGSDDDD